MRKVGIVSFHVAINYGVYLQAYALQEKIKELGYDASIVDYRKRVDKKDGILRKVYKRIFKERIPVWGYMLNKKRRREIANNVGVRTREKEFLRFAKQNFSLTKYYDNYESVVADNVDYDACVCGSDQIWNPNYTQLNPFYFLEFVESGKRVAYAPSIAIDNMEKGQEKLLKDKMEKIAFLSIREKTSAVFWEEKLNRTVFNAIDPTLLFPLEYWKGLSQDIEERPPYLLCYFLGHCDCYLEMVKIIKDKYNLSVVYLPFSYEAITFYEGEKKYASIEEFLGLIEKADFVLTDSFHGTAFSVNYNKDFYAIRRQDSASKMHKRVEDFLNTIGLESRIIDEGKINDLMLSRIDYRTPNQKISEWRKDSIDYLRKALESSTNNS